MIMIRIVLGIITHEIAVNFRDTVLEKRLLLLERIDNWPVQILSLAARAY